MTGGAPKQAVPTAGWKLEGPGSTQQGRTITACHSTSGQVTTQPPHTLAVNGGCRESSVSGPLLYTMQCAAQTTNHRPGGRQVSAQTKKRGGVLLVYTAWPLQKATKGAQGRCSDQTDRRASQHKNNINFECCLVRRARSTPPVLSISTLSATTACGQRRPSQRNLTHCSSRGQPPSAGGVRLYQRGHP